MTDKQHKFTPPKNEFFERFEPGEFQGLRFKTLPLDGRRIVDLRANGLITPVRQQLPCDGACTAFAFAAIIESYHLSNSRMELEVAAGWIHNCSSDLHCDNGANPESVKNRLSEQLVPHADQGTYPWGAQNCDVNLSIRVPKLEPYAGDRQFKFALQSGAPIAAAMAIGWDFAEWQGSIPYEANFNSKTFGHMVTIVGYDDDRKGWIVKNSLGDAWGDEGYFFAPYGSSGIGDYPAYGIEL